MNRLSNGNKTPIWYKYLLSIDAAADYFGVGQNKLRKLVSENPDANFIIWNGSKALIKRKKFEEYLDANNLI